MKRAFSIALVFCFFFFGSCNGDWGQQLNTTQTMQGQSAQRQSPILGAKTLEISIDDKWIVKDVTPFDENAKPNTPNPICVALVEIQDSKGEVVSLRVKCECYGPALQGRHLQLLIYDPANPLGIDGSPLRTDGDSDGKGQSRPNSSAKN